MRLRDDASRELAKEYIGDALRELDYSDLRAARLALRQALLHVEQAMDYEGKDR